MSAPRAGRAGGSSRGRGSAGRGNAPFAGLHNNRAGSSNARGGGLHPAAANNPSSATSRGTGRGRGSFRGAQRANKSWSKTPEPEEQNGKGGPRSTLNFSGDRQWRAPENAMQKDYKSRIKSLWETLKKNRVTERQQDIRDGKIADPEKKMTLSEAIKPVGTCEDMCSEWERVTRIYDGNVLMPEKVKISTGDIVPSEVKMVKRFQRSAAGDDEQLPSDLRPPRVLQRTLDYLIDSVINGPGRFERQQEFLWDRTRAIRNDFSIQQVTKLHDVKIAVHCFEQIIRYHILALHITAHPDHKPGIEHKQEVEQLTNSLTSLLQYYEDHRRTFEFPNEPEFCAYFIIREIGQVKRPDLESRVQQWPTTIIRHPRVQTALRLYAAACDVTMDVGPLQPFHSVSIAQSNGMRFWSIINSPAVPYLMACCAETYFRIIRDTTIMNVWRACKRPSKTRLDDLLLSDLTDFLGFDNEDQTQAYCESQGFVVAEREDGNAFLDLGSISASARYLPGSDRVAIQEYSDRLVEDKRHGRLPAAVIKGLSVAEARRQGLIEDADDTMGDMTHGTSQTKTEAALSVRNEPIPSAPDATAPPVFGRKLPEPSGNPFTNPFSKAASNEITAPSMYSQFATQAGVPATNPFAPLQPKQQASVLTQPTLSNQQIAGQIFSTSSHSPFNAIAFQKPPFSQSTQSTSTAEDATSTTGSNPFQVPSTKASEDKAAKLGVTTSTSQPETSNASTQSSIFSSLGTGKAEKPLNAGLGSTLFSSTSANPFQRLDANHKASATAGDEDPLRKDSHSSDSSSLFIPLSTQPAKPKFSIPSLNHFANTTNPLQENEATFAKQDATPSLAQGQILPPAPKVNQEPTNSTTFEQSQQEIPEKNTPQPVSAGLFQNPFASKPSLTQPIQSVLNHQGPQIQTSSGSSVNKTPQVQAFQPPSSERASEDARPTTQDATCPSNAQPLPGGGLNGIATEAASQSKSLQKPAAAAEPIPTVKAPSREQVLDDICNVYVTEPNGLLEQFIEHQVMVIVGDCWSRMLREKRTEAIANTRRRILGRKYLKRWRELSWKRKLTRNARRRREELRQSLRGDPEDLKIPNKSRGSQMLDQQAEIARLSQISKESMAPPPLKSILKKSNDSASSVPSGDVPREANKVERVSRRALRASFNRSAEKKMSNALALINVSRVDKSQRYSRLSNSMLGESGLMNERLMKEASRLVDGRTDTTRTDYFKLKALGLDPNTPIVPQTRKRPSDEEIESAVRKSRLSPAKAPLSLTVHSPNASNALDVTAAGNGLTGSTGLPWKRQITKKDNDDDLFAQINAVKSALSETETWYREYREQSERTSADLSNETEKQKKLREWRPSVSRTEMRWKKDGLPSFLRSSLTPRQTVSMERDDSRQAHVQTRKPVRQSQSEPEVIDFDAEEDSEEGYSDDDGQGKYEEDDELSRTDRRGRGEDVSDEDEQLYDEEEEEDYEDDEEEGEEAGEEDDHDDHQHYDTQAFNGFVNPGSTFATQGASADDAIEL